MLKVLDARFLTTAVGESSYPQETLPEIAFVGRSNVGKSSMINALLGRRKLVRVSNRPGRTRALNFFEVEVETGGRRTGIRFVDLPGYGFARVSKEEQAGWEDLITGYLSRRRKLKLVVAIVDGEVGPTPDDVRTLEFLEGHERRTLVVATKLDRMPKARRKPALSRIAAQLALAPDQVIGFSALEPIGHDETWSVLLSEFEGEGR